MGGDEIVVVDSTRLDRQVGGCDPAETEQVKGEEEKEIITSDWKAVRLYKISN